MINGCSSYYHWGGRILARTLFAPTLFALACSLSLSRQRELVRLRDELGELQHGEHQAKRAEQALSSKLATARRLSLRVVSEHVTCERVARA